MSVGLRVGQAVVVQPPAFSAAALTASALAPGRTIAGPAVSASHLAEEMPYAAPSQPQHCTHTKQDLPDPCFIA